MLWSYLISSTVLCRYLHPLEYILFDRMLFTREGPFMCPKSHACSMYLLLDLHSFYNVARLLSKTTDSDLQIRLLYRRYWQKAVSFRGLINRQGTCSSKR